MQKQKKIKLFILLSSPVREVPYIYFGHPQRMNQFRVLMVSFIHTAVKQDGGNTMVTFSWKVIEPDILYFERLKRM